MRATAATLVLLPLIGCSSGDETEPSGGECEDGACVVAGLPPDMPCAPAEWLREDGVCIPAGVPPDGCAEGFVHDGDRGCDPVLPTEACGPGFMAVPGETA